MKSFTTIDDLHPDVLMRALCRMDGPTLAALGSSASLFHSLSLDPSIWRELCLQAFPSLHLLPTFPLLSPRSFFADSFPFPDTITDTEESPFPDRVYSAVDIHCGGVPVFSRVVETDTSLPWFLCSVFRIDALERKEQVEPIKSLPASISPAEMELNWVMVDAETGRAVNLSSRKPVAIDRHWYSGETLVRYAIVLDGCAVSVVVTCGEETGHVREVCMTVEDGDGAAVSGKDSLVILSAAMKGRKRRRGNEEEEAKRKFAEHREAMRLRKESRMRREGILDLCCTAFGAFVFLAFLMLLAFR